MFRALKTSHSRMYGLHNTDSYYDYNNQKPSRDGRVGDMSRVTLNFDL